MVFNSIQKYVHTEYGNDLLNNFVRRVCDCKGQMDNGKLYRNRN